MATCALVGASPDFNAEHFKEVNAAGKFDYVIAVDGGFEHLRSVDVVADLVLGDFDSLDSVPRDVRTMQFPVHKDASDMELALEQAATMGYDDLYAYGAFGGRLDHALANLQVFAHMSEQGFSVRAVDMLCQAVFVTGPASFDITACQEGVVSVFSMSDVAHGVTERGLAYEVEDITLTDRTSLGLSNELTGSPATISVQSGTLVILVSL